MTKIVNDRRTPEQAERKLIRASQQYVQGKLSPEDFERLEQTLGVDYTAAARAIGAKRALQSLRRHLSPWRIFASAKQPST